ncbi:MAG: apolipoprotein N-acyltransferase, partial [Desulfobacula sp.]|nr:apolipoprotein N-acyltransferase [Desulfobacula sp.]
MNPKFHSLFFIYAPSALSGILLTLSFPKAGLSFLAFFALVPWLLTIPSLTAKQAFKSGLTAGLTHFITLLYWLVQTIHTYGGLHPVLSIFVLILLSIYLALYPALFGFLYKKFTSLSDYSRGYTPGCSPDFSPGFASGFSPFMAACLWTGFEYIRTYAFTGFSWGSLGYSQYAALPFIQIADITGVYGISFLIILINHLIVDWIVWFKKAGNPGNMPEKTSHKKAPLLSSVFIALLIAITLIYGHIRLSKIQSLADSASKPSVAVIQGNIAQDIKWSDEFKTATTEKYIFLSKSTLADSPDLIIWPESALPFYYGYEQTLSVQVNRFIRKADTNFLIGSPAFEAREEKILYFNRAYMLNQFSIVTGSYDKNHLVPFGEYVPFEEYLFFLGKMVAQVSDFSAGDAGFIPLKFKEHKTGVIICFEILFPHITSKFVKNGADMLITITNDAWFGKTAAPWQHFSLSVFRAVESRRSLVRAANTGISGFIGPTGKILEKTDILTDAAVTRQVPAMSAMSFYTRFGDIFAIGA